MIPTIPAEKLQDLSTGLQYEWLQTNGRGGYAMGTAAGANTRRYHGVFCPALQPPVHRKMIVNTIEDEIRLDDNAVALSCNLYGDVVHPRGHEHLTEFNIDPWPRWTYSTEVGTVEKSLLMPHGRNCTIVRYECVDARRPLKLHCRPLMSWRNHHHLCRTRVDFQPHLIESGEVIRLDAGYDEDLVIQFEDGRFWPCSEWYYDFTYPREAQRGLDAVEDLYCPGQVGWDIRPGETINLLFALDDPIDDDIRNVVAAEWRRLSSLTECAPDGDDVAEMLFVAADQFVVSREASLDENHAGRTIIAGYPWFTDWGRDTMISMPGLLLSCGRYDDARDVLAAYADNMRDGLIPNVFGEAGDDAAYNTVDATLWLFAAAHLYYDATDDFEFIGDVLFNPLQEAFDAHLNGTRFNIGVDDDDGLLHAGDEDTQLTWMDARVGDRVVTPRHGKPVEINALWYSAIRTIQRFAELLEVETSADDQLARKVETAFPDAFFNDGLGYFNDCVREDYIDTSLRPNQVIALAVPYPPVQKWQAQSALRIVGEKLLTPYGLRTLTPEDERYCGRYEGDPHSRDGAYHLGTVWPWLIGPFLRAHLKFTDDLKDTKQWARGVIQPLVDHLHDAGLGSISEIFDGDEPFTPRGSPAQAWSVAEVLRVWMEFDLRTLQ